MHLQYRPKFLPHDRETGAQRIRRRLGLRARTAFAPEPHIAPAALYIPEQDPRRVYIPGPVLCAQGGLFLFRDGPASDWPKGAGSASPTPPPAWRLWLEAIVLVAAIVAGGIVGVEFPQ